MALHPPAMGGKTAWGVSEVFSRPADDPEELVKAKKAQADFQDREQARLNRLKEMDKKALDILEERRARRNDFELAKTNNDEFKKRQAEILQKMQEAKLQKKMEKKKRKEATGELLNKRKKKGEEKAEEVIIFLVSRFFQQLVI